MLIFRKKEDELPHHSLLADAIILYLLAQRPLNYSLPHHDSFLIFALDDLFGIQLDHFLEGDDEYVRVHCWIFGE